MHFFFEPPLGDQPIALPRLTIWGERPKRKQDKWVIRMTGQFSPTEFGTPGKEEEEACVEDGRTRCFVVAANRMNHRQVRCVV